MKTTHYKAQYAQFNTFAQIRSERGQHEVEAVKGGQRQIRTFSNLRDAKDWLRGFFGFGNLKQVYC